MTADANTASTASAAPVEQQQESSSVLTSVTGFFASFMPTAQADEGEEGEESKEDGETEDGGDEAEEEEEEEDEPEDEMPAIYEECASSAKCKGAKSHFEHCQERVSEGKGFKGEDCIEEFFHLVHCASECTAPKIFGKLK